jgi:tRNA(Ile)-lysidine synthase TilS/MesJ
LSSKKLSSFKKGGGDPDYSGETEDLLPKSEENLRNRRYAELKKQKADFVVLGHNLSDRIESTFLNLLRGAGLRGFSSMQFSESHHLLP